MATRQISLAAALLTSSIVLGAPGGALAAEDAHCSTRTLTGLYVFSASGDVVPASAPPSRRPSSRSSASTAMEP